VRSCLIDGEVVACGDDGLPAFDRPRYRRVDGTVFLYAFDLLELDGTDLRREPFETRKATLASLLRGSLPGLRFNEHLTHDGGVVFRPCLQNGFGRDRLQAARLALPIWPDEGLAQVQKSGRACSQARGGRGFRILK
jgi:hypothetical protein